MAATDSDGTAQDGAAPTGATSSAGGTATAAPAASGTSDAAASTASDPTSQTTAVTLDPAPSSWSAPGEKDNFAMFGAISLMFILFLVIYLYAIFDRFAGSKGSGTPLRTTIPTMLTVGLAYDLLPPLEAVNILLPAALIIAALARDIALWIQPDDPGEREAEAEAARAEMAAPDATPREETAG